jgi:hypothetical protein
MAANDDWGWICTQKYGEVTMTWRWAKRSQPNWVTPTVSATTAAMSTAAPATTDTPPGR